MVDKEIIVMIEDTDREYQEYCDSRRCLHDECALLKNEDNIIDCQILFALYKFRIDEEKFMKEVNEKYMDYCRGRNKGCSECKLFKFKRANFDQDILPCCRICYVVLYMNDMLNLIEEGK